MINRINSALPHSAYHEPLTPDQAAMVLIDHQGDNTIHGIPQGFSYIPFCWRIKCLAF